MSTAATASTTVISKDGDKNTKSQDDGGNPTVKALMISVGGGLIACPRGTRDLHPEDTQLRHRVLEQIRSVFQLHGAVEIDTPMLERREILLGQYGDGAKLIYNLRDEAENKEKLSLRYDLTVPLARYVIQHKQAYLKRFHIGPVFRRDKPAPGRYRQFLQCDFDIVGNHKAPRMCDAECLQLVDRMLTTLDVGPFVIKVNHRKILNGIMALAGVKPDQMRPTCSVIDELDKISWKDAQLKLGQLGHSSTVIGTLGRYVNIRGSPSDVVARLENDKPFLSQPEAKMGLDELKQVFDYCRCLHTTEVLSFDLSLARGLDYYTGMILEGFLVGSSPVPSPSCPTSIIKDIPSKLISASSFNSACTTKTTAATTAVISDGKITKDVADAQSLSPKLAASSGYGYTGGVSSDASSDAQQHSIESNETHVHVGGGRYDELVGTIQHRFTTKGSTTASTASTASMAIDPAKHIAAVGISIGVERLFAILQARTKARGMLDRASPTLVYVASVGKFASDIYASTERLALVSQLQSAGIPAETGYDLNPKPRAQIADASAAGIPFVVWIGEKEHKAGKVRVKRMLKKVETDVLRTQLVAFLRQCINDRSNY